MEFGMSVRLRNNVKVFGRGTQPMIFAHGFGCDQNMWRFITPAFENDYQIVLYDHVGAGNSDLGAYSRSKYATLHGYANDLLEICAAERLSQAIFVGHSVSSMIGVLAAIREPDRFERLILIGPSPRYINEDQYYGGFGREDIEGLLEFLDNNHMGWSTAMAPVIMGNPERPELAAELTSSFCRTDPQIAQHFARVTFLSDNRLDLPRVAVPSLVLQCSDDTIAPLDVGEYVHAHLPQSQLVVLTATGHCPNLSAPEETIAAMKAYLQPS
jgi:sigma-B regulation protein RsbQ